MDQSSFRTRQTDAKTGVRPVEMKMTTESTKTPATLFTQNTKKYDFGHSRKYMDNSDFPLKNQNGI